MLIHIPVLAYLGLGKLIYMGGLVLEERIKNYLDEWIEQIRNGDFSEEDKTFWINRLEGLKSMVPKKETYRETGKYGKYKMLAYSKALKAYIQELKVLITKYAKIKGESADKMTQDFINSLLENKYIDGAVAAVKDTFGRIVPTGNNKKEDK